MKRAILDEILAARANQRSVVLATVLATGAQTILYPFDDAASASMNSETDIETGIGVDIGAADLLAAARTAAMRDRSTTLARLDGDVFLQVFNPPLRMIVVGAVHIAQSLVNMAAMTGFEPLVVDPRTGFATADRFPSAELIHEWPDIALERLALDQRTAVVTLTHDPKLDEPALLAALRSPAFYIGALGSHKTQAARARRLREQGVSEVDVARIHGPVGLRIGARSASEIALSIMAQVIDRLRLRLPESHQAG